MSKHLTIKPISDTLKQLSIAHKERVVAKKIIARTGKAERITKEVSIGVGVNLEGGGYELELSVTDEELNLGGLSVYHHFIDQIFRHGELGGSVKAPGDTTHHLLEELGMCLGKAIASAVGNGAGIERIWTAEAPLSGTWGKVRLDFGGRGAAYFDFTKSANPEIAGQFQHMLDEMAKAGGFEIQCDIGRYPGAPISVHHEMEAVCKALGRAIHHATRITRQRITEPPSTKGSITRPGDKD